MRESTLWILQIVTGALLVILLLIHLSTFSSFIGVGYERGLEYAYVIERGKNTFYAVLYIILLGAVLYHANYGLRVLLIELTGGKWEKAINLLLLVVGIIAFLYGSYVVIQFMSVAGV